MKTIGLTIAGAIAGLGMLAGIAAANPTAGLRTVAPQSTVEHVQYRDRCREGWSWRCWRDSYGERKCGCRRDSY